MEGYINVEVERAKKLANDVLIGVKEKREKLFQAAIKKEIAKRTKKNKSKWTRFFRCEILSCLEEDIIKYLREQEEIMKEWIFADPIRYL